MRIGFIGLGNVGGKLAGSLMRNGHDVFVRDLDAGIVAEFARAAISGVNVVMIVTANRPWGSMKKM